MRGVRGRDKASVRLKSALSAGVSLPFSMPRRRSPGLSGEGGLRWRAAALLLGATLFVAACEEFSAASDPASAGAGGAGAGAGTGGAGTGGAGTGGAGTGTGGGGGAGPGGNATGTGTGGAGTGTGTGTGGANTGTGGAGGCEGTLFACDGLCVDLSLNPLHCGACGNACDAVQSCTGGTCKQPASVLAIATAGGQHTCALLSDASVKCWGRNDNGQLGLGDKQHRGDGASEMGANLPALALGTNKTAKAIAAGVAHACAILNDNTVKCWGNNSYGQLGLGNLDNRGDDPNEMGDSLPAVSLGAGKTAMALAAGEFHTCALLSDGSVKCWGRNANGQLGQGDKSNRGGAPNQMGDSLPAVALGTGKTAKALAAGDARTCVLLNGDTVKCWGLNAYGQLGLGDVLSRGDGPNQMGDSLSAVALGTGKTAKALAAGAIHTCALLNDDTVKCWGNNDSGRLGLGDTTSRGNAASTMGDSLPAVALGNGKTAKALAAGQWHTCALLGDDTVKCWGGNGSGQLGMGDEQGRGDVPNEMGDSLPAVALGTGTKAKAIAAGAIHTCALFGDDTVKCWGANGFGQLGLGDMGDRGNQAGEMGDSLPTVPFGLL